MKKHTKIILFILTALFNVAFLHLCGYGSHLQPHTSDAIEPFFAVVAVALLGFGEVSIIQQLYLKDKFRDYKRRLFDRKLWRQCIALALYYVISIVVVASVEYVYGSFYIAIVALILSAFWMTGSRTIWLSVHVEPVGKVETSEAVIGYYLADLGKLYEVRGFMENEDVVEMICQAKGDRERTITLVKKKMKVAH